MTTIPPPKDDTGFNIPVVDETVEFTKEQYNYIIERLNKPAWKCSCGLLNNYYNERCANFRCKKEKP